MAKTSPEVKKQELVANLIGARSEVIDAATAVPRALLDSHARQIRALAREHGASIAL
jgi:hypothetical protein